MLNRMLGIFLSCAASTIALGADGWTIEHEGNKTTYQRAPEWPVSEAAVSPEIRTFAVDSDAMPLVADRSCEQMWGKLRHILEVNPADDINWWSTAICWSDDQARVTHFHYTHLVETASVAAIPVLEAYMKEREGKLFEDGAIHFRRAFGVMFEDLLTFSQDIDATTSIHKGEFSSRRIYLNLADAGPALRRAQNAIGAADIGDFLAWLSAEGGFGSSENYRVNILPETNYIFGLARPTVVLEDRSLVRTGFFFPLGERDCRASPTGFCI